MKKRDQANRTYAIMTVLFLAGILALSVTVWLFRPADLDEATLCPKSGPIAGHTLVILDRTDKWNPSMGDALTKLVEDAQKNTAQHQKFSIVSLDAGNSPHALFSVCNPGALVWKRHTYSPVDAFTARMQPANSLSPVTLIDDNSP